MVDALRYAFKEKEEVDSLPDALKADIYGRLGHTLKDTAIYFCWKRRRRTCNCEVFLYRLE